MVFSRYKILIFTLLIFFNNANANPSISETYNYIQKKLKQDNSWFSIKPINKCTILISNKHSEDTVYIKMDSLDLAKLDQLTYGELYEVTHRGIEIHLERNPSKPANSFFEFPKTMKLPKKGMPEHYYSDYKFAIYIGDIDTAKRIAKALYFIAQSCGAEKELF